MAMNSEMIVYEIDAESVDTVAVSGGVLPVAWLIAGAVAGAAGGGLTFGYMVGKDRAERDNRND